MAFIIFFFFFEKVWKSWKNWNYLHKIFVTMYSICYTRIYIVVFCGGLKCPCKIHFNTPPAPRTVPTDLKYVLKSLYYISIIGYWWNSPFVNFFVQNLFFKIFFAEDENWTVQDLFWGKIMDYNWLSFMSVK